MFTFRLFEKSVYEQRRNNLRHKVVSGLILMPGNDEVGMNYRDNFYPFRQDSTFLYYFGINTNGLTAIIDVDAGLDYLFGDDATIDDVVWTGPLPTVREMAEAVGVSKTGGAKELIAFIQAAQRKGSRIHYLPPYRGDQTIKLSECLGVASHCLAQDASVELIKAVVGQRQHKEERELAEMDHATRGKCGYALGCHEVRAPWYEGVSGDGPAPGIAQSQNCTMSFNPIVTIRGETLHNLYCGNTLAQGDMLLVDAGATNDMLYAGDLTTTYPVGKKFTTVQREVYETVLNAHKSSVAMLRPGVLFRDVYHNACVKIVEGMKAIGLMKGDVHDAVVLGAHAMFFQCGLGHMIGLDVHDMENLGEQYVGYTDSIKKSAQFGMKSLRLAKALDVGFALTVEPGIYFIPLLMDRWRAEGRFRDFINYDALNGFRDFGGIRVEEDYVIIENGSRLIGNSFPIEVADVERAREQAFD